MVMTVQGLPFVEATLRLPLMSFKTVIACLSARFHADCLTGYMQCWLCKPTRLNDKRPCSVLQPFESRVAV